MTDGEAPERQLLTGLQGDVRFFLEALSGEAEEDQDDAEMERNFLRWDRPEGAYPDRDGKFIAVVPTIPLDEQRGGRSG